MLILVRVLGGFFCSCFFVLFRVLFSGGEGSDMVCLIKKYCEVIFLSKNVL